MEEVELRPTRAELSCSTCGLTVERTLKEDELPSAWFCPDCDPDQTEDEQTHHSSWMQSCELYAFTYDEQHQRDWIPKVFQECAPHRPVKEIPAWVQDTELLKRITYTHPQSGRFADRWAAIVYRYYILQEPASWIAADLNLKTDSVKSIIKKLNKRAAALPVKEREKIEELSRARKLFEDGGSVRAVARELNFSTGKAHKLKKLAKAA
jgi:hypothetical protein